ncbi:MAG: energy-coupling factor ABC transporter permease [Cyanobacteriota bacterium]
MSHIHIPDGVLPVWLWLSGFIIVIIYLIGMGYYLKNKPFNKKLPLVGVFVALMIIAMSIEIVPIAYHIKLDALTGIILGPLFSVLCIFIVNLILALVGHGGITIVGLNTIVLSIEAIIAYIIFKLLYKKLNKVFLSAFLATIISLFIATWGNIGVVYLSQNNIEHLMQSHESHKESFVKFSLLEHNKTNHEEHTTEPKPNGKDNSHFDMKKFILFLMLLGPVGWLLESLITAFILKYVSKIKPDILEN